MSEPAIKSHIGSCIIYQAGFITILEILSQSILCPGFFFEGTQLPEWDKLLEMLTEAALELPSLRYIGWDVAYSTNGWCIIEGNTNGEFFTQMVYGHGFKSEFEKLIDWKISDQLWKHPLLRKESV